VTVYVPAEVTVIDVVVAPLLHNKDPVNDPAVSTELPQLLTTETVGADGIVFGAAVPLPAALVHPSIVWVTVYVPPVVTSIDEVVEPLLHNNEPVNPEAVNTELSQLSTTATDGADGVAFGAAVPLPAGLVNTFTVCVTVYVPPVVTVIDAVVAPVFHNNEPVNPDAVNSELPQLLTTLTVGVATSEFAGAAVPLPAALVHPFTV
jgi:hypothetical protein